MVWAEPILNLDLSPQMSNVTSNCVYNFFYLFLFPLRLMFNGSEDDNSTQFCTT